MEKEISSKKLLEFINAIPKLEPVEFLGLAKILRVKVVNEKTESRPFEDILEDMIDNFINSERKRRKEILKIIKESIKRGKEKDGNATKN